MESPSLISALTCANPKSWGHEMRTTLCSIDLAKRQGPSYFGSCIDSGNSKGSHLKMALYFSRKNAQNLGDHDLVKILSIFKKYGRF